MSSLGRYEVRGEIGRGTMGVVYRGHDPVLDRPVALKTVVLPDTLSAGERETFLKRFLLEARIAGKLTHANIVIIYDAATDETTRIPFIAMELMEGESLSRRLERQGRCPWREAVGIVRPLAQALDYAHQEGIVHRDIKPANVIFTGRGTPKIADFGIAKLPTAHLTRTGVVVGTPYFMSPEQLRGEVVDGRSDLFSLGALLYNLVVGRPPFDGSELAVIASQVLYKNPAPPSELVPDIPESLDAVLSRALAKAVGERYGSAAEFAGDLASVQAGKGPRRTPSRGERTVAQERASALAATDRLQEEESKAREEQHGGGPPFPHQKRRRSARWRIGVAAGVFALIVGFSSAPYRPEESRRPAVSGETPAPRPLANPRFESEEEKPFSEAKRAAEKGNLEASEKKLEQLLEKDPDFDGGSDLLSQVTSDLFKRQLPLAFRARHNHRIGRCIGTLTLDDGAVEFQSGDHGWRWEFHKLRVMERKDKWSLALETNEEEMFGLVKRKRYNFHLYSEPLEDEDWFRYQRLAK